MALPAQDVIVALSTAFGPGGRAVVRLSGPDAAKVVTSLFQPEIPSSPCRLLVEGRLHLPGTASPLPADFYLFPAPHSYTGEDVVEIHTLSSPPLLELLTARLLQCGARGARPAEAVREHEPREGRGADGVREEREPAQDDPRSEQACRDGEEEGLERSALDEGVVEGAEHAKREWLSLSSDC